MRNLILATASAMVLGLAGAGEVYAQSGTAPTANPTAAAPTSGALQSSMPQTGAAASQHAMPSAGSNTEYDKPYAASTSPSPAMPAPLTQSEIRQVQQKLRSEDLYRGRIDGRLGPETSQALRQYQRKSGLPTTAALDQDTLSSLLGTGTGTGMGQGSSTPPSSSTGSIPSNGAGASGTAMPTNPSNTTR